MSCFWSDPFSEATCKPCVLVLTQYRCSWSSSTANPRMPVEALNSEGLWSLESTEILKYINVVLRLKLNCTVGSCSFMNTHFFKSLIYLFKILTLVLVFQAKKYLRFPLHLHYSLNKV